MTCRKVKSGPGDAAGQVRRPRRAGPGTPSSGPGDAVGRASRPPHRPRRPRSGSLVVVTEHRLRQGAGVVLQQTPAARTLAQDGPAAVGEPAEPLPVVRLQAQQPADRRPDRAAVADHDERAAGGQFVGVLQDDRGCPVGDLGLQLAAAPADRLAALPRGVLVAVPLDDLLVRQPLPDTRVRLAERGVVGDGEAGDRRQLGGRGRRPPEVGGDDGVGLQRGEQPGGPAGLREALLGQLDVRGALEAALQVPRGLAVPPEDDSAAPAAATAVQLGSPSVPPLSCACSSALPRVLTASSGRAISGQSFHRRSSA